MSPAGSHAHAPERIAREIHYRAMGLYVTGHSQIDKLDQTLHILNADDEEPAMRGIHLSICLVLTLSLSTLAQSTNNDQQPIDQGENRPTYRVTAVSRTTKAVNYRNHSGGTDLGFRGTDLMPEVKGKARVESRTGRMQIDLSLEHLRPARSFGPEYLTYVVWAITPEGRAVNLGEIVPNSEGKRDVTVSTDLQAFGLIVTAEPYFAVTRPSDLIVAENVVESKTKGWELPIDAKFDALQKGQYTSHLDIAQLPATSADPKTPTDLLEARNAVAIAKATGAETYASDTLKKAEDFLARGEDYLNRKQGDKAISTVARGAVQSAEDARILTIRKKEQEEQEAERRAQQERIENARQQAENAQQQEAAARARAELEAQQRAQADADRRAAEQAREQAEQAQQQAEAARQAALQQQQAAQAAAQQATARAQEAEQEKEQTRARLMAQLNQVLQTRESARGLIVNMPDVLFDTGKYTLKPGARERLAKVAGILVAYPGLQVQVEGHTDSVGSDEYNQRLSENRAESVRDYLSQQGVQPNSISARGFGKTEPIASNDTASGRQLNRRVDLVVSGEAIGTTPTANGNVPAQPSATQPGNAPGTTEPGFQTGSPETTPATPPPAPNPR